MTARLAITPNQALTEWLDLTRRLQAGIGTLRELTDEDVAIARTPKEAVYRDNKMVLYRYTPRVDDRLSTPVLLVYALVGRYNVADLQPGRSFIEKLLDAGLDVYAIDWGHPSRGDRWLTLDDYVNVLIDDCVEVLRKRHHVERVNLLSICQGGVFNLCYAALHPEKVKNLVLTVTPVDFHADRDDTEVWRGFVHVWTRGCRPEDIDLAIDALGNLPGALSGFAFASMNPIGSLTKYSTDLVKMLEDREALTGFLRMERWLYDQPDHAGEAGRQWLKDLYQANRLAAGTLELGGKRVDLRAVKAPILNIYAEHDHVVPPACAKALRDLVGVTDYTELGLPGGHIGVFVGGRAQKLLAPTVSDWFRARA